MHHLTGTTTEMRQQYRDEVIGTDREAFKRFADVLRSADLKVAVFGSKEALEQANEKREEKITITELK